MVCFMANNKNSSLLDNWHKHTKFSLLKDNLTLLKERPFHMKQKKIFFFHMKFFSSNYTNISFRKMQGQII